MNKLPTIVLSPAEAREFLVGHHGLRRMLSTRGAEGLREMFLARRCIQLDPLNVLGTNADVVAAARVNGIKKGDVYQALLLGHGFEHFAKERCLLPAHFFPWYQTQAQETPWWRLSERKKRLSPKILDLVLSEVHERGPVTAKDLTHHGKVKALDWNGWKGTSSATSMALEVLWTQCRIVVSGRKNGAKVYDVPERALPKFREMAPGGFSRWALLERVEMAGLLSMVGGPHWSMLSDVRTTPLPKSLVEEGTFELIQIEGSPRRYLAPRGFRERPFPRADDRMRLIAPLDSLVWDRGLVQAAFAFEYIWEVYKPAAQRRWAWYVYPLLHRGHFVGRMEAKIENEILKVQRVWLEPEFKFDSAAFEDLLKRHATFCGAKGFLLPKSFPRS